MRQLQIAGWTGGLAKFAVALVVVLVGAQAFAQTTGIRGTRHNLSSTNAITGANKVSDTAEVCVFCHTPHGAATGVEAPLWNKNVPTTASYQTYTSTNSSTLEGEVLSVGSVSLACLSCHDGTQAMDNILNAPGSGGLTNGGGVNGLGYSWTGDSVDGTTGILTAGAVANIGADLRNDHPIGVQYCGGGPNAGAPTGNCNDKDFVAPSQGLVNGTSVFWVNTTVAGSTTGREKSDMILYNRSFAALAGGPGPSVECASCHDPHVNNADAGSVAGATFLRVSNSGSAVCLACHVK